MSYSAKIRIDPSTVIGTVNPHLYGANLEQIGRSVYGGVWSEMLKSRKFAGHDRMYIGLSEGLQHQNQNYGIVEPWVALNPDYQRVLYVHDNTTFYTGNQSQRITIRQEDGHFHGIQQSGLYLEAGRLYSLRLVLKGEDQPVTIELGDQESIIDHVKPGWATYRMMLTTGRTNSDAALRISTRSAGNLWIGCASLMPADNSAGHRADVISALKEWRPTFLRWPGGNFASAYHWRDAIGDPDRRASYLDPAWNAWEPNDVGTDEFMTLCHLVGSEPILTINMGNGTADEAAAWVEYCNGDSSTPNGALRAANGHPAPYNVKTWFVGNEQFGNWQVGHCDAETYARRYKEFAHAMRAVDSSLRFIAVGVPADLYGHWNELVLDEVHPEIDLLSVHYYSIRTERWDVPPPADELYAPKVGAAYEVAQMLDATLAICADHSAPPVPIAFDEWNTYVGGKAPDFFEDYSIADALYTGALMNACLQRCDRIHMSAIFNLINVMGNYRVTPALIWKTPSSLVLELFTHHRGPVGISCDATSPVFATPAAGNLPAFDAVPKVDAAATYDPDGKTVYLSVVNRDPVESVRLTIEGIEPIGVATLYFVSGDSPLAMNDGQSPRAVQIEQSTTDFPSGNCVLPPHSLTMLIIPIR